MAERDFDAEFDHGTEEHRFTLGGYRFRARAVAPPGAFLDASRGLSHAVRFLRRVVIPEDRPELERILEMPDSSARLLDMAPDLLTAASLVVATDDEARAAAIESLREVIAKIEEPQEPGPEVSAVQIDTVASWLMEATIGRPLASASPSSGGAGRTGNGSKATSRKPARASAT